MRREKKKKKEDNATRHGNATQPIQVSLKPTHITTIRREGKTPPGLRTQMVWYAACAFLSFDPCPRPRPTDCPKQPTPNTTHRKRKDIRRTMIKARV